MKTHSIKIASLFLLTVLAFSSCKKNRTCTCTLTYFNGTTEYRDISAGKTTIKKGQNKCNDFSSNIVTEETKNGLNSVKCEIN